MKLAISFLITTLFCLPTWAQKKQVTTVSPSPVVTPSATTNSYSYSPVDFSNHAGSMHVQGALGWFGTEGAYLWKDSTTNGATPNLSGLIAVGGDFEYMLQNDLGVGGLIRYYGSGDVVGKTTSNTDIETSISTLALGAFSRVHIPHRQFDFYMAPGFGITSTSAKLTAGSTSTTTDTGTVFTFFIQTGLMYALTHNMAAGFETTRYLPWSSEFNGWLLQDFALKFRYSL